VVRELTGLGNKPLADLMKALRAELGTPQQIQAWVLSRTPEEIRDHVLSRLAR